MITLKDLEQLEELLIKFENSVCPLQNHCKQCACNIENDVVCSLDRMRWAVEDQIKTRRKRELKNG